MARSIFISYRRADSQHAAFAIADRLGWAFGHERVFFDRSAIEGGEVWPDAIQQAIASTTVAVIIIGANWLRVADKWGRRRLDDPKDWVRREVCELLARSKEAPGQLTVIPVYLDGVGKLPPEALDKPLRGLPNQNVIRLASHNWEDALNRLIEQVRKVTNLPRIEHNTGRNPNGSPSRPPPEHEGEPRLSEAEIATKLKSLSPWEVIWSPHVWGIDGYAQELTRWYAFADFIEAICFMSYVSPKIDGWEPPHHPRWENQWKVVNVFFTTWDIGCRVTELDVRAASDLDKLHYDFTQLSGADRKMYVG